MRSNSAQQGAVAVAERWERISKRVHQHAGIAGDYACFPPPENGAESYPQKTCECSCWEECPLRARIGSFFGRISAHEMPPFRSVHK
jgi:hypothetical protein